MAFNHEKLKVYQRTLPFNWNVSLWVSQWDCRHAICDQLPRAAGSMLENIAMASAAYCAMKQRCLDYAIGSTLECAACLDLAHIKKLIGDACVVSEKDELSQIMRMLVGLRRSWAHTSQLVMEERAEYGGESGSDVPDGVCDGVFGENDKVCDKGFGGEPFFHHEALDVYQVAIEAVRVFCSSDAVCTLSSTLYRRLDELLTSMVLNIAEGNGRFSDADQRRFLKTSHEAAIKMAARLDLYVIQRLLPRSEVDGMKHLLERVSNMTSSMIRGVQR